MQRAGIQVRPTHFPQELPAGLAPVLVGGHRHEVPYGAAPPGTPVDHRDTQPRVASHVHWEAWPRWPAMTGRLQAGPGPPLTFD
jgi:hypothetical protein